MSVISQLRALFDPGDSGVETFAYRCAECGNTFESAKPPDEGSQCMECLSRDVERAEG